MWERESLLLLFHAWRRFVRRRYQNIETTANDLGLKVILRYCFQRWQENRRILSTQENLTFEIIRKRRDTFNLLLHFSAWFNFSGSRGRRIRNTRKYWDNWLSCAYRQKQERQLYSKTVRTIQVVRKAALLTQWRKAIYQSYHQKNNQQEKLIQYNDPRIIYLLSCWFPSSPKLLIMSCWKAWKGKYRDKSCTLTGVESMLGTECKKSHWESKYKSWYTKETLAYTTSTIQSKDLDIVGHPSHLKTNTIEEKRPLDEITQIAKEDLHLKKIALAQSIMNTKVKKKMIENAKKNIIVQKRTLKLCHHEIENHCCICGGIHIGNDHIAIRKRNCSMLKMKQQVFTYLQQSLKDSITRLEELKGDLEEGARENTDAKIQMNQSLISFVESTCVITGENGS